MLSDGASTYTEVYVCSETLWAKCLYLHRWGSYQDCNNDWPEQHVQATIVQRRLKPWVSWILVNVTGSPFVVLWTCHSGFFLSHPPCLNHALLVKPSLTHFVNIEKYATGTHVSFILLRCNISLQILEHIRLNQLQQIMKRVPLNLPIF
jgi:hypothetical protein